MLLAAAGLAAGAGRAANAPAAAPDGAPSAQAVLDHLNAIIRWYRQAQTGGQWILEPSDVFFWNTQKDLAAQAVQAAFASAAAEAALVPQVPAKTAGAADARTSAQRIGNQIDAVEDRLDQAQDRLGALDKQMASTPGGRADPDLQAQRDALQAEVRFYNVEHDALQKLASFVGSSEDGEAASLAGQIRALQRSVPEAFNPQAAGARAQDVQPVQTSGGLVSRAVALFTLVRSRHALDELVSQTAALRDSTARLAAPLRGSLRAAMTQAQGAAAQLDAASGAAPWKALSAGLAGAAGRFSQASGGLLPLRQESAALDSSLSNLQQWQESFNRQYTSIIRVLVGRAAAVLAAMAILAGISEIWRRATFRYVHDPRRRRQLLVVRRICTGVLMVTVIVLGFVSDFSSLATFAGFITAGLAVALQTVILSVAAYFFLIGRYGVRVGDRVTVSGVTGEVIDVGLVRVYMMELAGTGTDLHPTGRVVVFANSALFQAAPLYKQIPGTDYGWHQVAVGLAPDGDHAYAQEQVTAAVNRVYDKYKDQLERQHQAAARIIDVQLGTPGPASQLRFTDAGIEVVVRYPVEVRHAGEIDDAVTHGVLDAIRRDPKLKQAIAGGPRIRLAA